MKNSKNKRTTILALILIGLLIVAYKFLFATPIEDTALYSENVAASQRVEALLKEVEAVSFNEEVLNDPSFLSLESLEGALPTQPVGKRNPFLESFDAN